MKLLYFLISFLAVDGVYAATSKELGKCQAAIYTSDNEFKIEFTGNDHYHNGMDVLEDQGVAYVYGDYTTNKLKLKICPISYSEQNDDAACSTKTIVQNEFIDGNVAVMWDKKKNR